VRILLRSVTFLLNDQYFRFLTGLRVIAGLMPIIPGVGRAVSRNKPGITRNVSVETHDLSAFNPVKQGITVNNGDYSLPDRN